jgi:integrase
MPKKAAEMGPLAVKRLSKPGLHAVGGAAGLLLQVKESGARSWILRVVVGADRRHIGLGGFPDVTLAQAREVARNVRAKVRAGIDPIEERRAARRAQLASARPGLTFREAAERWHRSKVPEYKNRKHAAQVLSTLLAYGSSSLGDLDVADVSLRHVLEVLEPIWTTKTETAARLRGRIENVLSWATVSGYRSGENPARWKGNLDALLPKPGKVSKVEHHRALAIDAVPSFVARLGEMAGMGARAVEFLLFTATRSGEVRGATWDEVDLKGQIWTIPADRMKAGKEHRVPLSTQALRLLRDLPRFEGSGYVFTAARGGSLSDMTLSAVFRRMEVDAVPHGLRSTFRDWAAERTNYAHEVVEMALAHTISNQVERAYRRGDLFEKRTALMRDWARHFVGAPVSRR